MSTDPRSVAEGLLRAAVSGRPQDMADFYAEHAVIEMPFAPVPLYPVRTETTREELRARFAAGTAVRRYTTLEKVLIHETTDPEVIIVEYDVRGEMLPAGDPFVLSFVMVMTIRAGKIVHTRDYADPIAGARALGRLPELTRLL